MKVEFINPFIESIENTFKTMCGVEVSRYGDLCTNVHQYKSSGEIFSVIHLSGATSGTVVMVMGGVESRHVIRAFLGETTITDEDLMDGFGELLNVIVGGATSKLPNVKVSAPRITFGRDADVYTNSKSPWVIIPMKFPEWGHFCIEVSIKD